MALKDIFNSIGRQVVSTVTEPLSSFFPQPAPYTADPIPKQPKQKMVDPSMIPQALQQLESSGGMDPNTPKNEIRSYSIPAANGNEQPRTVSYNTGFGGHYGITPVALAQLAKSQPDPNAATSTYTKYGPPLIPGMDPKEIQKELQSVEGAGRIAQKIFLSGKGDNKDFSPNQLTSDYIDKYVGKGTKNDTPQNRKRVLSYLMSIAK